jgi:hypothetical protein
MWIIWLERANLDEVRVEELLTWSSQTGIY